VRHLCTPQHSTVYSFDVMCFILAIWKVDQLHCVYQAYVLCIIQAVSDKQTVTCAVTAQQVM